MPSCAPNPPELLPKHSVNGHNPPTCSSQDVPSQGESRSAVSETATSANETGGCLLCPKLLSRTGGKSKPQILPFIEESIAR
eukprot:scaffold9345_cov120-Cylindrotheca_fusiformis.AAC.14